MQLLVTRLAIVALASVAGSAQAFAQTPTPSPTSPAQACSALVDRFVREAGSSSSKSLKLDFALVDAASGMLRTGSALVTVRPSISMLEPQHLEVFAPPEVFGPVTWTSKAEPDELNINADGLAVYSADRKYFFGFKPSCLGRSLTGVTPGESEATIMVWEAP